MNIRRLVPGVLDMFTRLSLANVRPGKSIWHEVCLGSVDEEPCFAGDVHDSQVTGMTLRLSAFPSGWASIDATAAGQRLVAVDFPIEWAEPAASWRGLGTTYLAEAVLTRTEVRVTPSPPTRPQRPQIAQHAEVQTVVTKGRREICRLSELFWIDIPPPPLASPVNPRRPATH